jgi:CubicO group peptidase (beta-lactamase class C family)
MADAAARSPITRASRFGMASVSKLFTAVAILQLVQEGKLALDDTLAKLLPGFPDAEFARGATIHRLLSHTAGAGDYWDDEYERHWGQITEHSQMLPHVLRHLGESPPGEYSYSNSGYILLGLVIEAVTGQSFYDHVQRRVLGPAGMIATGYPKRSEQPPGAALPYDPEMEAGAVKLGSWLPARLGERGTSAGGASATADDLLRFVEALRSGRLLDAVHLELLTRPHVEIGPDRWYGYGTMIARRDGVVSWGHGGSAPGTQFELEVFPAADTVLVMLSNYNTIAGVELASALGHLVRNEPAPQP